MDGFSASHCAQRVNSQNKSIKLQANGCTLKRAVNTQQTFSQLKQNALDRLAQNWLHAPVVLLRKCLENTTGWEPQDRLS